MPLFTTINSANSPEQYTIEGTIAADGTILKGTGFTVDYLGTGCYVVEFDEPFFGMDPEITVSVSELGQGSFAKVIEKNVSAFKYFTIKVEPDTMYLKNYKITFSASGLKKVSGSDGNINPETRVIEGSVSADGKIISGEGFSVEHLNTGAYLVTFDKPFDYISPFPLALEVVNPYIEPYGYKVDIIGQLYTTQFKYFTYVIDDTTLTMKDIALSKFMVWGS